MAGQEGLVLPPHLGLARPRLGAEEEELLPPQPRPRPQLVAQQARQQRQLRVTAPRELSKMYIGWNICNFVKSFFSKVVQSSKVPTNDDYIVLFLLLVLLELLLKCKDMNRVAYSKCLTNLSLLRNCFMIPTAPVLVTAAE